MEEIVVSDSWQEPVIAGSAWTAILGTGDVATESNNWCPVQLEVVMEGRINVVKLNPGGYKLMYGFAEYLAKSSLDEKTHRFDPSARIPDQRLRILPRHALEGPEGRGGERSAPVFPGCLAGNDFLLGTGAGGADLGRGHDQHPRGHVSDEVFDQVRAQFSQQELADLTLAVVAINGWNRLNIAFRTPAGTYRPGQFEKLKKTA